MNGIKRNTIFATARLLTLVGLLIPIFSHAETGNVVLWNRLGSDAEIANSEIGPGFTKLNYLISDWQEAQLAPGMFDNGLFINHDLCEGWCYNGANFFVTDLSQTGLTPARGSIEFWFEFKYGADTFNHAYFFDTRNKVMNHYPDQNWQADGVLTAGWSGWDYGSYGKRFFFCVGQYNAATCAMTPDYSAAPGGDLAFNDGTLMHFAFVWDADGIAGTSDTVRIYVNGEIKGVSQTAWSIPAKIDPYLFLGSSPNCCNWDHHYNAVKGVTDNLVISDYAKTDYSERFVENPGVTCDSVVPQLSAGIAQKTGVKNARIWNLSLANNNRCPAENAQIDSLVLSQNFGTNCTPVITNPTEFPLLLGNIAANSKVTSPITMDFSSCPNNARFSATISFSNNNGAATRSKTINNQFR